MEDSSLPRKKAPKSSNSQRKSQPNVPPLAREEWDFRYVPELDLPICFLWEYWREKCRRDPSIADALNNVRKEVQSHDKEIRQHDQRELSDQRLILAKNPNLPEVYAGSLKFYGKFNLYLWSSVNPLSKEADGLANISEEYFPCRAFLSLEPLLREIVRARGVPKGQSDQLPPLEEISLSRAAAPGQPMQNVKSVLFHINWDHPDESIQEAFREWVHLSRGERKPSLTKGLGPGKSMTKKLFKNLKDLGAMRLLTHYGSSSAAFNALQNARSARFADKAEWSKAKKHAESILEEFKILSY